MISPTQPTTGHTNARAKLTGWSGSPLGWGDCCGLGSNSSLISAREHRVGKVMEQDRQTSYWSRFLVAQQLYMSSCFFFLFPFSCAATLYPTPFFFSFLSVHGLQYTGLWKLWGAVGVQGVPGGPGSPQTKSNLKIHSKPNQTKPKETKLNQNSVL